jgi:hypothetical protein
MITKTEALTARNFEHVTLRNVDGTPVRCRVTGQCKTWKTWPEAFKLPVKHGLRTSFYLTHTNAHEWVVVNGHERPEFDDVA